jgi:HEAT repeat protein
MAARLALACLALALPPTLGACAGRTRQPEAAQGPIWQSQIRERALVMLAAAARDENALIRANALEGLAAVPMRARPFVFDGLTDRNLGVRYAAAMLAGRLGFRDAAPLLRDLLDDPDASVRAAAIYALSALKQPVDPGPLAGMLLEGEVRTRAQAAFILGEMGNKSAVPLLREALMRPAPNARLGDVRLLNLQIAEALAKLGDADAFEAIRAALYPSRPEELEAAALAVQIIGEIGDRRSIDQLIYMAERTEDETLMMPAEVRLAAAASLAQLGLPRGDFVADEYAANEMPAIRAQAAFVYGRVGSERALQRLEPMLDDPSPIVAVSAAAAIVQALSRGFG